MKKENMVEAVCPLCLGMGKIYRKIRYSNEQAEEARRLYKEGFTLREIAAQMGIKHQQTVKNLITRTI